MCEDRIIGEQQEYRRRFVVSKPDVYEKKFDQIDEGEGRLSWNWCAFLFTPLWLLYRKLYAWFFAYIALTYVVDLICTVLSKPLGLDEESGILFFGGAFAGLAIAIYFGINGDRVYLKRIDRCFASRDREQLAQRLGGTSVKWAVIGVLAGAAFESLGTVAGIPVLLLQIIGIVAGGIIALILFKREQESIG